MIKILLLFLAVICMFLEQHYPHTPLRCTIFLACTICCAIPTISSHEISSKFNKGRLQKIRFSMNLMETLDFGVSSTKSLEKSFLGGLPYYSSSLHFATPLLVLPIHKTRPLLDFDDTCWEEGRYCAITLRINIFYSHLHTIHWRN